jgi:hypothetical protein
MHEGNYHKATRPDDLVMLWHRQNDAVLRLADQKAFDALPPALRSIVNDSPVQLFCPALRLGCRRYGASTMIAATQRLLEEWRLSFARDTVI